MNNSLSGVYSSITQESSQIRTELHNAESTMYSSITQTESQLRSEMADEVNG